MLPAPSTDNFDLDLIFGTFPAFGSPEFSGVGEHSEWSDKAHPVDPLFGLMDAAMLPSGNISNSGPDLEYDTIP